MIIFQFLPMWRMLEEKEKRNFTSTDLTSKNKIYFFSDGVSTRDAATAKGKIIAPLRRLLHIV